MVCSLLYALCDLCDAARIPTWVVRLHAPLKHLIFFLYHSKEYWKKYTKTILFLYISFKKKQMKKLIFYFRMPFQMVSSHVRFMVFNQVDIDSFIIVMSLQTSWRAQQASQYSQLSGQ